MDFNFINYIIVMLIAGLGSFGGGMGGANIIKEFALTWANEEMIEYAMNEIMKIISISQYGGYAQGMTLAVYLGTKTSLGILGGILGVAAFLLPSVLIVVVLLKIGETLYKNNVFKYSIKYMNLLAAGLICMLFWNYVSTIFVIDPIMYVAVAGLACFFNLYFQISPVWLVLGGAVIGIIWRPVW